jgi:hypothetical protein
MLQKGNLPLSSLLWLGETVAWAVGKEFMSDSELEMRIKS